MVSRSTKIKTIKRYWSGWNEGDFYWYQILVSLTRNIFQFSFAIPRNARRIIPIANSIQPCLAVSMKRAARGYRKRGRNYWLCETCKALTSSYFNGNLIILLSVGRWNGFDKIFTSTSFYFSGQIGWSESPGTEKIRWHPFLNVICDIMYRWNIQTYGEKDGYVNSKAEASTWKKSKLSMGKTLDIFRMLKSLLVFLPSLKSAEASPTKRQT